jgi:hypothetical protein
MGWQTQVLTAPGSCRQGVLLQADSWLFAKRGIGIIITRKSNEKRSGKFDKELTTSVIVWSG